MHPCYGENVWEGGGGAAQQRQIRGESGLLAFIFCTFGDGAETPLVRFISTSDPNPRGKTNPSFRQVTVRDTFQWLVVGAVCIGTFSFLRY